MGMLVEESEQIGLPDRVIRTWIPAAAGMTVNERRKPWRHFTSRLSSGDQPQLLMGAAQITHVEILLRRGIRTLLEEALTH